MQRIAEPPLQARAAAEAAVSGLPALAPPVVVQVQPCPAAPVQGPSGYKSIAILDRRELQSIRADKAPVLSLLELLCASCVQHDH